VQNNGHHNFAHRDTQSYTPREYRCLKNNDQHLGFMFKNLGYYFIDYSVQGVGVQRHFKIAMNS